MANSLVKLTLESNQYEQGLRQAQQMWKNFTDSIGLSAQKFTAASLGIGAVTTALKVAKDAFFASQQNIDAWEKAIDSAQSVYTGFLNTLNTGDISGFITNINTIVQAATNAKDALSDLADFNAFNQVNVQNARTDLNNAIVDFRSGNGSRADVINANERLKNELRERQKREQEAYNTNIAKIASQYSVNPDDLKNLLSGPYDDWSNAKKAYKYAGTREVAPSVLSGGSIGMNIMGLVQSWFQSSQLDDQERLSVAARNIPTETLNSLQKMGQQAAATGTEIVNLDKSLERVLSRKVQKIDPPKVTGTVNTQDTMTELEANQKRINALTQEYVDISSSTVEVDQSRLITIREEIDELTKRNDLLKLYAEQAKGLYLGGGASVFGLASSQYRFANADLSVGGIDPSLLPPTYKQRTINNRFIHKNDEGGTEAYIGEIMGGLSSGMDQIVSGIENLGIEIPDSIKGVLNAVQGITSILAGISTMVTAIVALQEAGLIKFWSNGGVVHAMGGYEVPGNYGYDAVPSMLTSGELVLNRSQQNTLASALKEGGNGGGGGTQMARLSGEQIYVAINRYLSRSGKGELVTWR